MTSKGSTIPWAEIDGGDEAQNAFRLLAAFLAKLTPGMTGGATDFLEEGNFDVGFPDYLATYGEDGDLDDESWLRRTRRQRIDPDAFEPPSGYKRMSMGPQ